MQRKRFEVSMPASLHLRLEYFSRLEKSPKSQCLYSLMHEALPFIDPAKAPDLAEDWKEHVQSPENEDDPYIQPAS